METARAYAGPQCPRCEMALSSDLLRTGHHTCPYCLGHFEATAFEAPQRVAPVAQLVVGGPEEAGACANHARNAAVTSCQRCGLFICALCDMNVGTGSYCPSCFERMRTEGALRPAAKRYRDYASMARSAAIFGTFFTLMFLGLPFGALTMYYAYKGRQQRRDEGRSRGGMIAAFIVGALQFLAGIGMIGFVIYSIANA